MERHAFTLLHDMEDSWWYRGRALVVKSALGNGKHGPALDVGAGLGGMHDTLATVASQVLAFEPDSESVGMVKSRGYSEVFGSMEEALNRQYSLIAMLDVLEHIDDDEGFLKQLIPALLPEGRVLVTVPAYKWLWGPLDESSHHKRRYTKTQLAALFKRAGYDVTFQSYWNTVLFPVAAIVRLFGSTGESGLVLPRVLDTIFLALIRIEALVMKIIPLPFGLSVVLVAKRAK